MYIILIRKSVLFIMKKLLSLILMFSFIILSICNNCSAITVKEATIEQLLYSALVATNKNFKNKIMDELSTRDTADIENVLQSGTSLIAELEQNLEKLKANETTTYRAVQKVNEDLLLINKMQELLNEELYRRMPWSKYLLKKALGMLESASFGAVGGTILGILTAIVKTPFVGFNPRCIVQGALSGTISSTFSSMFSDIFNKLGPEGPIYNALLGYFISLKVVDKVYPINIQNV